MARRLSAFGMVVVLLLMVAVASISGGVAAVLAVKHVSRNDTPPSPPPVVNTLAHQAEQAITVDGKVNKQHALYLSRLFQGIAMRLAVDANNGHKFNTSGKLAAIVADAGSFAVQGVKGFDYPQLPSFIKDKVLVPSFGEPAIDKTVTVQESLDFADTLTDISVAFNDVSEK